MWTNGQNGQKKVFGVYSLTECVGLAGCGGDGGGGGDGGAVTSLCISACLPLEAKGQTAPSCFEKNGG